jgi:hypothetical protein
VERHESQEGQRTGRRHRRLRGRRPASAGPATRVTRLACAAALLLGATGWAADVDASLTGLLQARPTVASGEEQTFVPFYAQMGLRVSEKSLWKFDEVRAEVGAWGRLSVLGTTNSGDVDLAYISAKALDRRLTLTLGRQFVTGGAVRALQVDGLSAEVVTPINLGLSAFGGVPVISRFALAKGDAVWGGRVFWRPTWESEVGASYLELMDVGQPARRDVGLDFRTFLFGRLALSGLGVLSALESRLEELDLNARVHLSSMVELTGAFRQASPDLFLPRTSIFSTFADVNRTEGSLGLDYSPSRRWTFGVDGRVIGFADGLGYQAEAQAGFRPGRDSMASLQVVRLSIPSNAYTRARLAGKQTFGKLLLSADIDAALFDTAINGRTSSLQGQLTAKLTLPANFDLLVSGLAATDPLFAQRYEVLARVVYTFRYRGEAR